jgi:hypothetical protein
MGEFVVIAVQICNWHLQCLCELDGDLEVSRMYAELIAIHARGGDAWVYARGNAEFSL